MPEFIPFLKKNEIAEMVGFLAQRLSSDYKNSEFVVIGVLKGAFMFVSDLVRGLTIPVEVDFVRVSSYGDAASSSGTIRMTKELELDIKGKDVLIVEDIIDTGLTLAYIAEYVKSFSPKSVKICTLLDKRERRMSDVPVDYACCIVEKGFLVGYGLDYAEKYRNLPEIYDLKL